MRGKHQASQAVRKLSDAEDRARALEHQLTLALADLATERQSHADSVSQLRSQIGAEVKARLARADESALSTRAEVAARILLKTEQEGRSIEVARTLALTLGPGVTFADDFFPLLAEAMGVAHMQGRIVNEFLRCRPEDVSGSGNRESRRRTAKKDRALRSMIDQVGGIDVARGLG